MAGAMSFFGDPLPPSQLLPYLGPTSIVCVGDRDPATRVADIAPARGAVPHE